MPERVADGQVGQRVVVAHTVRHVVRDGVLAEGITDPDLWAVTLHAAADLVLCGGEPGESAAHRVAGAAISQALLLGISLEEAARCIREDAPFDIFDPRARRRRHSVDELSEACAPLEDRVWEPKRRGER